MELMEARNKLDAKDKVSYIYTLISHVMNMFLFRVCFRVIVSSV